MARRGNPSVAYPAVIVRIGLACLLNSDMARADDHSTTRATPNRVENQSIGRQFRSDSIQILQLTRTEAELEAIIRRYQASRGHSTESSLEEVTVKAPMVPLKMRDSTRDIWGSIAAPFWALLRPTQARRILLPVPAKKETEPSDP